jgi:hypothetical protein
MNINRVVSMLKFLAVFLFGLGFFTSASAENNDTDVMSLAASIPPQVSLDGRTIFNGMPIKAMVNDPTPPTGLRKIALPENFSTDPSTATSTFSITYIAAGGADPWGQLCSTFPAEARTVFDAAANVWANILQSTVPITISACWSGLSSSTTLGYSGGGPLHHDFPGATRASTWFGGALANALSGADLSINNYDMHITYNSNFSWYYGIDGNPPSSQHDLFSVVLHEIAHGLNFSGSMQVASGIGSWGYGLSSPLPNIYDTLMRDNAGNVLISAYASGTSALAAVLTAGGIYFHGNNAMVANGGTRVKMYAPATWSSGSSYSHLDYAAFNETANELMVYAISAGEAIHDPGVITRGLFKDLGWPQPGACTVPSAPGAITYPATDNDGSFTVGWSPASGATSYTLEQSTSPTFTSSTTVYAGASTSYNQTGLGSGTFYYRIRANNSCGSSVWRTGEALAVTAASNCTPLTSGVGVNVTVALAEEKCYRITVPAEAADLTAVLNNLTADLDLYTRNSAIPSTSAYDCRPYLDGTVTETCSHPNPIAGDWYLMVYGYNAGSGTITATVANVTPTCGTPSSISLPTGDVDGRYTVSWGSSIPGDVTYELEEATNSSFTSGLRKAYSGTDTSVAITERLNQMTYFYRVKATRSGYFDSGWQTGDAGVEVEFPALAPILIILLE